MYYKSALVQQTFVVESLKFSTAHNKLMNSKNSIFNKGFPQCFMYVISQTLQKELNLMLQTGSKTQTNTFKHMCIHKIAHLRSTYATDKKINLFSTLFP